MKLRSLLLSCALLSQPCFAAQNGQMDQIVRNETEFSFSLYSQLKDSSNTIFSPYSIFSCLSMIYTGSRGDTAAEMKNALYLDFTQNKTATLSGELANALKPRIEDKSLYELTIANGVWVDEDTYVLSDFRHVLEEDYEATIQELDFHKTNEAMSIINEWVSNETKEKIPRLLQEGDIDGSTRMVLTNAIYFKGEWQKSFDATKTAKAAFHPTPKTSVDAMMMDQTSYFLYFESDLFQMLALPFLGSSDKNSQLACLFLLPYDDVTFTEVEKTFSPSSLQSWISGLKPENVRVKLPKFQMTQRLDLNKTLQSMGMKIAFTDKADFSGINGMRDLFLSKVVHEAFFSLDENGVTAAAATGGSIGVTAMPNKNPLINFIANRPFLYFIVDLNTKTPLFMGKLQEPVWK